MVKKQATERTVAAQARRGMAGAVANDYSLRTKVLLAARDRCDELQDGQAARDDMKRDVLATPDELLSDLLTAFLSVRIDCALLIPTTAKE